MKTTVPNLLISVVWLSACAEMASAEQPVAVELPSGVKAVWDIAKAEHNTTATRDRVSINGLWRWQPAERGSDKPPADRWGYFKVPGCWPGITDYEQKDSQTIFAHPSWKGQSLGGISAAWYEREITIPSQWSGRRIELLLEYLNSYAAVFLDRQRVGELRFPGGTVDLTSVCKPAEKHLLSLLVVSMPLDGVMLSYNDTNSARQVKGSVNRRGLCGDAYLVSIPQGPRIEEAAVATSVRHWEISIDAKLCRFAADSRYSLQARISKGGQVVLEFKSRTFQTSDLKDGRVTLSAPWKPDELWDIITPQNTYELHLLLLSGDGGLLDAGDPVRFGFREFWIAGRDFYLNGTRIFLSAVPLDNGQIGAAWATYSAAHESLERLKSFGINFVYTHNYGCEPGSHLSFAEILRAADDVGMLVALSQPHFSHYDWKKADAEESNGYARHAEFYAHVAGNHPSVIAYAMSHNATGYDEDMNPDMIDGLHDPRDQWSTNNARLALRAEAIVKRLDPSRIVYHHSSGNLGSMHTSNFYPNFVPIQELCDWFEHWATKGVKPVFTCEYGAPFSWDWGMYRGWYKGNREWGSAKVPWEFCLAEWNAQFLGDRAYRISDAEKANLRWEAKQFAAGDAWHRWDYPYSFSSRDLDERWPIFATYLTDAWRAFRGWGVSAISPWEHELFWKPRQGVDRKRKSLDVDWERLQRPGFSPDYIDQRYERFDLAFERSDWIPTPAARALLRNNLPLLAFIAGKPEKFTSKDHNFFPGETVQEQLIVINNSRRPVTCECRWSLALPQAAWGDDRVVVETGQQRRIPINVSLPGNLPPGRYELQASVKFSDGQSQADEFAIDVVARPVNLQRNGKIAVFDPKGETSKLLRSIGLSFQPVRANDDLSAFDVLIVGESALTVGGPSPSIARVRDGLRVLVFEQSAEVLEQRLGFRVEEYGLRTVFPRVPSHPALAGLAIDDLHDWRGDATLLPPRLKYELRPRYGPTVSWCGLTVPRVWRCGNSGNVASVLIEKPERGDFLPIVDGGFNLQYSPLLEYREGRGVMLFCQLDVTGRSESEPAAEIMARNLLEYVSQWRPAARRTAIYAGDTAAHKYLKSLGISAARYDGGKLTTDNVLVVGPGGGKILAANSETIAQWLRSGGQVLAFGLDQQDVSGWLPKLIHLERHEHIAAYFDPPKVGSPFVGVGPADVQNRDPRDMPLVAAGARIIGDGVLAQLETPEVVFCQLVPCEFTENRPNQKKTYRRASYAVARILANMGVAGAVPIVERFRTPIASEKNERRWLDGLYVDHPEEWDDPYRFFRW
jgi:hypothetical protein